MICCCLNDMLNYFIIYKINLQKSSDSLERETKQKKINIVLKEKEKEKKSGIRNLVQRERENF